MYSPHNLSGLSLTSRYEIPRTFTATALRLRARPSAPLPGRGDPQAGDEGCALNAASPEPRQRPAWPWPNAGTCVSVDPSRAGARARARNGARTLRPKLRHRRALAHAAEIREAAARANGCVHALPASAARVGDERTIARTYVAAASGGTVNEVFPCTWPSVRSFERQRAPS